MAYTLHDQEWIDYLAIPRDSLDRGCIIAIYIRRTKVRAIYIYNNDLLTATDADAKAYLVYIIDIP